MWVAALCLAAACYGVSAQPISCYSDNECGEGYYCERSAQKCFECLRCSDVKKESPSDLAQSVCVKSFVDCGPCLKGLVVDNRGDVNAECVSPETQQSPVLPLYLWVLIGLAIAIVIFLPIGFYLYRKPETFKVWASTSIRSLFDRPSECQSAPDLPPPYNPNYVTNHNVSYAPAQDWIPYTSEDTTQPFVKRAQTSQPQDAREAADNQTAIVFNRPAYSYEDDDDDSVSSPEPAEDRYGKYSVASPLIVQEEDTMPSIWEPHEHDPNGAENNVTGPSRVASGGDEVEAPAEAAGEASTQLALVAVPPASPASPATPAPASPPAADEDAPAPKRSRTTAAVATASRVLQDTNNNRSRDSNAGPSASNGNVNHQTPPDNQTSVFINVVINNAK